MRSIGQELISVYVRLIELSSLNPEKPNDIEAKWNFQLVFYFVFIKY